MSPPIVQLWTGHCGHVETSAANRLIGEVVQSRRRPLLGPFPGCLKCESASRHFQPGEGPSRGLLRDCTTSPINRFAALLETAE